MDGYIKLHRKFRKWEWYQKPNTLRVFLELLLLASYKDTEWKGIKIKRGQLITSRKSISKALQIGESPARCSLNDLQISQQITVKSTNKFSIITILNYEKYQNIENNITNKSTNKSTNKLPTNYQQITLSKETKETKEIKKECKVFTKPTPEQIMEYCKERKNDVDYNRFFNFYESKGWLIGKSKMKDWKAAVRTWEKPTEKNNERKL